MITKYHVEYRERGRASAQWRELMVFSDWAEADSFIQARRANPSYHSDPSYHSEYEYRLITKEDAPALAAAGPKLDRQVYKAKKLPTHLVPPALTIGAARALEEGLKYGQMDWRNTPVTIQNLLGAIERHLMALKDGEDFDPDSPNTKHHMEGIAASAAIYLDSLYSKKLTDDRPTGGPAGTLIRAHQEKK